MPPMVGLVLSYLLGSVPIAYVAGKLLKGIDLRDHGSKNLGATNVFRVMGWRVATPVLMADIAKGAIPVAVFAPLTVASDQRLVAVVYGMAAIFGHVRPIFLLWTGGGGGKGVATATGVFLALAPLPTLAAIMVFLVVLLASGYVSLGSLSAAIALPMGVAFESGWDSVLFGVSVLVSLFVFWMHRANIGRLRRGEESRFGPKREF